VATTLAATSLLEHTFRRARRTLRGRLLEPAHRDLLLPSTGKVMEMGYLALKMA